MSQSQLKQKKRLAGGSVEGTVTIGYRDDWQREGLVDAPARVVWFYELLPGSSAAAATTTYLRWVKLHGDWLYVEYLDTMLDAAFTGLMIDAERRADESAMRRYRALMARSSNSQLSLAVH